MSVSNKTYTLGPMKQLIDLNGDITNFDLTFTATSHDGSAFDVLVVDQTTLDSNPQLEYKKAEGTISGNIVSDKGIYQNYFLILKSDSEVECDVSIEIKEIPQRKPQDFSQQDTKKPKITSLSQIQKPKSTVNWFLILAFVLGFCILLWYFYGNKKNGSNISTVAPPRPSPSPSPSPNPKPKPSSETFNLGSSALPNKNLIERLNKLKIIN